MEPVIKQSLTAPDASVYPPPPWKLSGECGLVFYLVDIETVRPHVPFPLEIVTPIKGRTLGGYYCGWYDRGLYGEPRPWGEFGLVAALARYGRKKAFFISEMLTDNPAAWRGGMDEWGLDKTLAAFKHEKHGGSTIMQVDALARFKAEARLSRVTPGFPIARDFGFFSIRKGRLQHFTVRYEGRASLGVSRMRVPVNEIGFPKPTVKMGTTIIQCSSIVISGPEDIDLRGFRPRPDKDVRVPG